MTTPNPLVLAFVSACALALLLVPSATAHPAATTIDALNGERCYIFWNDMEIPEYWLESNGVTTGGVPNGEFLTSNLGLAMGGSGLQRGNGPWGGKDTRLSEDAWLLACGL